MANGSESISGKMIHKNILKSYAPKARRDFIKAVTERAAFYGITEKKIVPIVIKGDFVFISGRPFPKNIDKKRNGLIARVQKSGFEQTMEEIAYTWFNRFMAIRFMEVNGYLSHGYHVISHPEGHNEPEILEKAQFIEKLDGLEKDEIIKLKTAAGKESELYRRLIIAQCNDLSAAMPFLFERVDDPSELLLPDNLLNTDSVIRKMTGAIPEEDWKEVEIVGWLYQFYIAEKKDELMKAKKAYKTEEIPAVTQLFTPNWIVKYLVQNSLGAKWLASYPKSGIKAKMEYYITPAEQSDEVKARIKEITPDMLNPEELTVMDPACGSGHILAEAYDLLKEIYLERGYRARDIAGLILTKNLFGLEIDERAAQLAGFALVMRAYADDREIFKKGIKPNIICLRSGSGVDAHIKEVQELIDLFENAKTFGSLIRVPDKLQKKLPEIRNQIEAKRRDLDCHDVWVRAERFDDLLLLVNQAEALSRRYDCVIANPPYMGGKGMNAILKEFAKSCYPDTKSDLFAMFIERGFEITKDTIGYNAMITQQAWMFLSSYEKLRTRVIKCTTMTTMAHNGYGAFGADFGTTIFAILNEKLKGYKGLFISLREEKNVEDKRVLLLSGINRFIVTNDDYNKIPGSPIAYWVGDTIKNIFNKYNSMAGLLYSDGPCKTGNDDKYLRHLWEISSNRISMEGPWRLCSKGGPFRRYYGNIEYVMLWTSEAQKHYKQDKIARITPKESQDLIGITWTIVTSSETPSFRLLPMECLFNSVSPTIFLRNSNDDIFPILSYLNSTVSKYILNFLNPTMALNVQNVLSLPLNNRPIANLPRSLVEIHMSDWNSFETSYEFSELPILHLTTKKSMARESYNAYRNDCRRITDHMVQLEQENNRIFIEAYCLQDEITSEVPIEEITLFANPRYRYRGELSNDEIEARFKADTMKEFISYAVGCMMGRYSLDVPGLVYAHAENKGFDSKKYKTFMADEDGIIPITEREWFDDDAASRLFRFVEVAWDKKGLDENLDFIADAIGRKSGEPSREAIRRYFLNDFYKDHCQTYKNRPIYWLFTSGKEKAFQSLVYLHRYNEGTLARMRTEYVLPLQTKIARHIEHLLKDKDAAAGAGANIIQKEIAILQKQQAELSKYDEKLRHYADMRIKLDLDDGVKANYAKFGELLEPIKGMKYGSEED